MRSHGCTTTTAVCPQDPSLCKTEPPCPSDTDSRLLLPQPWRPPPPFCLCGSDDSKSSQHHVFVFIVTAGGGRISLSVTSSMSVYVAAPGRVSLLLKAERRVSTTSRSSVHPLVAGTRAPFPPLVFVNITAVDTGAPICLQDFALETEPPERGASELPGRSANGGL